MSPLRALEAWYARTCDGDWEHSFGVTIETLDNPGWAVRIDLAETALAGRPFEPVRIERAPDDWLHCAVEADVFEGHEGRATSTRSSMPSPDGRRSRAVGRPMSGCRPQAETRRF